MTAVMDAEVTALRRFLQVQRDHVLGALDGLDEDALRRPVLPSGWSCVELVQHLTWDVERLWFRAVVAGCADAIADLKAQGDAWEVAPAVPAADVLEHYRQEVAAADAAIAALQADAAVAWWPDPDAVPHLHNLRDVLLHVITETACHAGHLDAVRELIDGRRWLVVP